MNSIDFNNICRSCGFDRDLQPIQDNFVIDLFQKLIDSNYAKDDELPQKICETCLQTIYNIQKFVLQCKTMDLTFKKYKTKNTSNILSKSTNNVNSVGSSVLIKNKNGYKKILKITNIVLDKNKTNVCRLETKNINNNKTNALSEACNKISISNNEPYILKIDKAIISENKIIEVEKNTVSAELNIKPTIIESGSNVEVEKNTVRAESNVKPTIIDIETTRDKICNIVHETNEIISNESTLINEAYNDELTVEIETNKIIINESNVANGIESNPSNININDNEPNIANEINRNEFVGEIETNEIINNESNISIEINSYGLNVEVETNKQTNDSNVENVGTKENTKTINKSNKKTSENNTNTANSTNTKVSKKIIDLEKVLLDFQNQFPFDANVDLLNRELELVSLKERENVGDFTEQLNSIFIPASRLFKFDDDIVLVGAISSNRKKEDV